MIQLRHFNIFRTIRLEHEVAALRKQHEAMRADVVNYYDITSRGLDPRGDAALLSRAFRAENDLGVAKMIVRRAVEDMACGRVDAARSGLGAILGDAYAEPEPIHLVDVVA